MELGGVGYFRECYLLNSGEVLKARAVHSVLVSSFVNNSVLKSGER